MAIAINGHADVDLILNGREGDFTSSTVYDAPLMAVVMPSFRNRNPPRRPGLFVSQSDHGGNLRGPERGKERSQ